MPSSSRWSAQGNVYLVVADEPLTPERVRELVGDADGIVEVLASGDASADVAIWNVDGSRAEMSGNGTRIAAAWLAERTGAREVAVRVGPREVRARLLEGGLVEQDLGEVRVGAPEEVAGVRLVAVDVGNPHAVVDGDPADLPRLGPLLSTHERFPQRTNVQVARVVGPELVEARVWERGVGETASSGSSAVAVVAALGASPATVRFPGGELRVRIDDGRALLTGPAVRVSAGSTPLVASESHHARAMAESFGTDPERYDRTRPRYPRAMVDRIVAAGPGPDVLDVGTGTGIASRQFGEAGCRVLGVEPDARMAEFARRSGLDVEVARFEEWDAAGRTFDLVVAGQTWHWVDPVAGAARAAEVLRPAGRLAVFWNVFQLPPDLAAAVADVYRRVLPDSPFAQGTPGGFAAYAGQLTKATDGIRAVGAFDEPEEWRFDWERPYTRDEWLDQVPTWGGHGRFPPGKLDELLAGIGAAIDDVGGTLAVAYATVAVTAVRAHAA